MTHTEPAMYILYFVGLDGGARIGIMGFDGGNTRIGTRRSTTIEGTSSLLDPHESIWLVPGTEEP